MENNTDDELGILENEGINVWGKAQEVLEQQALNELEILANEKSDDNLEDGEIPENVYVEQSRTLDINDYIKSQAEFQKVKDLKKAPIILEANVEAATSVQVNTVKIQPNQKSVVSRECLKKRKRSQTASESSAEEHSSESEYIPSDGDSDYMPDEEESVKDSKPKAKREKYDSSTKNIDKVKDDGLIQNYETRLEKYYEESDSISSSSNDVQSNISEAHCLKGGLKVPKKIWHNLYGYQQDGVKWLWEVHQKATGGILGDEMGLGKTVQVIAFLAALDHSRISSRHTKFTGLGPTIIVCPATVIHQWVQHFHEWIPEFRVAVLHQSGSYTGKKVNLIRDINKCKSILITTYIGVLKYKGELSSLDWHYVVLDEGHKIRNASAKVTVAVKQLKTPYRLLLTGSPMQNNLQELWSLFDFTNPGMLGASQTFMEHFANPIVHGGFLNATPMQEATALSMATALKNLITPYLLRRSKNEVQDDILLPSKSEQVLFCSLTEEQKQLYKGYLMTEHVNVILGKGSQNWYPNAHIRANMLTAITTLRKICNHPDLYLCDDDELAEQDEDKPVEEHIGYYKRCGKMIVVSALLKIWKKQGHRVLLFSQGRAMVKIFEKFLKQQEYKYLKMDGTTSIASRQPLIHKFNQDESYFVFLLTTRVGGLGINLTGANRVIIFDPDWNPATDTQARERAWRIGQNRQVTIYRLLSAGTIEEKMYQRQVWKQLLSNKVLLDPRTNHFFRNSDLHDLFSLQEQTDIINPETTNIFRNSRVKLQQRLKEDEKRKEEKKQKKQKRLEQLSEGEKIEFSAEKLKAMRELAHRISKSMGNKSEDKELPIKTPYQKQIEEERSEKLKEKQELKKLTPLELMCFNRKKAGLKPEEVNRIDDYKTAVSFEDALEISESASKIYHVLKDRKTKPSHSEANQTAACSDSDNNSKAQSHNTNITPDEDDMEGESSRDPERSNVDDSDSDNNYKSILNEEDSEPKSKKHKNKKSKHKAKDEVRVDRSGTIDGQQVDGLVKAEMKKTKKEKCSIEKNQDDFILEKLFSKKGVSGALQHDSVVQCSVPQNMRIEAEAQDRTDRALQALRKSRLDTWKW